MRNENNKSREPVFVPYGLKIPKSEIFDSARNLGVAITGALTSTPPEDIEINRAHVAIGLGCFSFVGISINSEYEGAENLELVEDDFEDCRIYSAVRFYPQKLKGCVKSSKDNQFFLNFNIIPKGLLNGVPSAIQIFAPKRLITKLKSPGIDAVVYDEYDIIDIDNYLEGALEPSDAILTPSKDEFDLVMSETNPEKRFGLLMNMITSFASVVSAKLMHAGTVSPTSIIQYSDEVSQELHAFEDGRLAKPWKPTKKQVEWAMNRLDLRKKDIDPSVRKILWPKKKG